MMMMVGKCEETILGKIDQVNNVQGRCIRHRSKVRVHDKISGLSRINFC